MSPRIFCEGPCQACQHILNTGSRNQMAASRNEHWDPVSGLTQSCMVDGLHNLTMTYYVCGGGGAVKQGRSLRWSVSVCDGVTGMADVEEMIGEAAMGGLEGDLSIIPEYRPVLYSDWRRVYHHLVVRVTGGWLTGFATAWAVGAVDNGKTVFVLYNWTQQQEGRLYLYWHTTKSGQGIVRALQRCEHTCWKAEVPRCSFGRRNQRSRPYKYTRWKFLVFWSIPD